MPFSNYMTQVAGIDQGDPIVRTIRATPKPSSLIESMRDIGYSLEAAIADIIDNSISANARKIDLFVDTSGDELRIAVLDDGEGMSEAELEAAMRPGNRNPRAKLHASELGRFGLGLKTASFSQCRKLTVVSRKGGKTSAACWDLDHVAKTDEWEFLVPSDISGIAWTKRLQAHGTLVLWEKLDRVTENEEPSSHQSDLVSRLDEIRDHLELVFHRFLAGESGLRRVQMAINDRPLTPFDPFFSSHETTIDGPVEKIRVGNEEVIVQCFTLPHHRKVTAEEWERYAGREGYLRNQGFYLYRGRRLIIYGTWFGLIRQSELTKLARVKIDIPNTMDSLWKIDVKKASAQPPRLVKDRLRRISEALAGTSKRIYVRRAHRLAESNKLPVWIRFQRDGRIIYRVNPEHPVLANFIDNLPKDLQASFKQLLELVVAALPVDLLFADMGGDPKNIGLETVSDDTLLHALQTTYEYLVSQGFDGTKAESTIAAAEPFLSNWARAKALFQFDSLGSGHNA